jgi:group I intron endonuclease
MNWFSANSRLPKLMNVSGVYVIKHMPSGFCYVGSSVCCRARLWRHLCELRKGEHFSKHLQRAWKKYAESEFYVGILEEVRKDNLLKAEQVWIDRLDSYENGYNGRPKAKANYGMQWSEQQNAARQRSNKKSWADPRLREALSRRFKGRKRGTWSSQSHERASETLRQRHKEDPSWRVRSRKVFSDPEIERRRTEGVRASLQDSAVYKARVQQLRKASLEPSRLQHARETYFKMHDFAGHGVNSTEELDAACVQMYQNGATARGIGKHFGIDHKSVTARLRRLGVTVEKRYAKGEQRPDSKLSEEEVRNIRRRLSQGSKSGSLAKEYGVSTSVISEIKSRKTWKHLK